MKIRAIFFLFILFFISIVNAQHFGPAHDEQLLEKEFWESTQDQGTALDSLTVWQEQILLHTDKDMLAPKDHLFFKAYVLTGSDQLRVSASDVLKIELLDNNGALVNSQYHKIVNGATEGSIMIPKKTKPGQHYLRAYTRWMLNYGPENFATKEIVVQDKKNTLSTPHVKIPEVQFFPEGGHIIMGLENRVAVSIEDDKGNQIEVVDKDGNKVANVKNYGNGLGIFFLTPEYGKEYSLKLGENKRIALPEIANVGYTMQLNNIGSEDIIVKIATTENVKNQEVYLRGRVNGINFFETRVKFENSNVLEVDIPKSNLPNGMLQLQLEDEFDQIWATRPLHISNKELHFEIEKSEESGTDMVKIKVTDAEGSPVQTELSVALNQNKERRGQISENARNLRFLNDLLVLTHRLPKEYDLNKMTELPTEIKYNFQKGLEFYGRAYDLDAVPLPNTKIQIVISGEEEALAHEVMTNEEGLLKLSGLQIKGEADMIFRRTAEGQKDRYVKVISYEYEIAPLKIQDVKEDSGLNSKQFISKKQIAEFKDGEDLDRLITLEGVTLIGEKPKVRKTPSVYNIEPTRVVFQDPERPRTIPQLFLSIPGVQVSNLGNINPPPSVSLPKAAGSGRVLWVLDGIPLSQAPVEMGTTPLADIMSMIPFTDVERIEILFGPQAAIYGTRSSGGAILIYTRNGGDENHYNRKEARLTFEGYHDSLSFETYQKRISGEKSKVETSTLYWNPSLNTDENGEAFIKMPNISKNKTIKVEIKAITSDGKSGSLQTIL